MLRKFAKDETGSATIEFVVWVPWFMLLLMIMVDVSTVYYNHTLMVNASRDAARRMSIGEIDQSGLTAFVQGSVQANVSVSDCSSGDNVCVSIEQPFTQMAVFARAFPNLVGRNMVAATVMRKEPGV